MTWKNSAYRRVCARVVGFNRPPDLRAEGRDLCTPNASVAGLSSTHDNELDLTLRPPGNSPAGRACWAQRTAIGIASTIAIHHNTISVQRTLTVADWLWSSEWSSLCGGDQISSPSRNAESLPIKISCRGPEGSRPNGTSSQRDHRAGDGRQHSAVLLVLVQDLAAEGARLEPRKPGPAAPSTAAVSSRLQQRRHQCVPADVDLLGRQHQPGERRNAPAPDRSRSVPWASFRSRP